MKKYFETRISKEKKLSTWIKRSICLLIGYIVNTYCKEELISFCNTVVEFLTNNYQLIAKGFFWFSVTIVVFTTVYLAVMLVIYGEDGLDEIFEKGEGIVVKLISFILKKINPF